MNIEVNAVATYFVDKKNDVFDDSNAEKDVSTLAPKVLAFLKNLVESIYLEEEKKYVTSGFFTDDTNQEIGASVAQPHINAILANIGNFATSARELANRLYQQSPKTAAPGLLAIMRLCEQTDNVDYVCILKIRYKDESFVKIPANALTELTVELVENMLLSEIQKGAIIPHPSKSDYELKVIDNTGDDPAQYFTDGFLGCRTKKSDTHQIKSLISELEKLGAEIGVPIKPEKLPAVIASLQEKDIDVTPSALAEVAEEQQLYESTIDLDSFASYFQDDTGRSLDIPAESFAKKGKKKSPRSVTLKFIGGEYNGVSISGKAEVIKNMIQVDGDLAIIHIETTRDGYKITYE